MKRFICLLTSVAALGLGSISNASITGAAWQDDGDKSMVCTNWTFSGGGTASGTLAMSGIQSNSGPAHMLGTVETSSPQDPTLTLGSSIVNESGIMWIGYQVNVIMGTSFTFVSPGPSVSNAQGDWYLANVWDPTLQATGPYAGKYEGSLFFNAGTPVGPGGQLDYLYSISFAGFTSYSFTQEAYAYMTYVPEPSALALVGMGGLMLALRTRRNRAS
jgi:hypothetical protein